MWPYMEDPIRQVLCNKDEEGKVRIGKKQVIMKRGWNTRKYKYMADPYDREELIRRVTQLFISHQIFLARKVKPQIKNPASI